MLEAGIRLLKEFGYHGMSIKQLVDDIGVPKGSFYNYFPSKEAFVEQAIIRYGENSAKAITETLASENDPIAIILQTFSALGRDLITENGPTPCLVSTLANEISQTSDRCRESLKTVQDMAKQHLTSTIEAAQAQALITQSQSAQDIAEMLYNNWHGQLMAFQIHHDAAKMTQQTQQLLALLKPTL